MIYMIVEGTSAQALVEEVNRWIEKGWFPTGGVAYRSDNPLRYMQAMTQPKLDIEVRAESLRRARAAAEKAAEGEN